jgi:hypothetical protein
MYIVKVRVCGEVGKDGMVRKDGFKKNLSKSQISTL